MVVVQTTRTTTWPSETSFKRINNQRLRSKGTSTCRWYQISLEWAKICNNLRTQTEMVSIPKWRYLLRETIWASLETSPFQIWTRISKTASHQSMLQESLEKSSSKVLSKMLTHSDQPRLSVTREETRPSVPTSPRLYPQQISSPKPAPTTKPRCPNPLTKNKKTTTSSSNSSTRPTPSHPSTLRLLLLLPTTSSWKKRPAPKPSSSSCSLSSRRERSSRYCRRLRLWHPGAVGARRDTVIRRIVEEGEGTEWGRERPLRYRRKWFRKKRVVGLCVGFYYNNYN